MSLKKKITTHLFIKRSVILFFSFFLLFADIPAYSFYQDDIEEVPVTTSSALDYIMNFELSIDDSYPDNGEQVFNDINDFVINVGDKISFKLLNDDNIARLNEIKIANMPKGAVFRNNIFTWTIEKANKDEYGITFKLGKYEKQVNIYVLDKKTTEVYDNSENTISSSSVEEIVNNNSVPAILPMTVNGSNIKTKRILPVVNDKQVSHVKTSNLLPIISATVSNSPVSLRKNIGQNRNITPISYSSTATPMLNYANYTKVTTPVLQGVVSDGKSEPLAVEPKTIYTKDINFIEAVNKESFTETSEGAERTYYIESSDAGANNSEVSILHYDLSEQLFAGMLFSNGFPYNIEGMNTLGIRIRGDENGNYPSRVIIEMKSGGKVISTVLIRGITDSYKDIIMPFYSESNTLDEIVVLVEENHNNTMEGTIYIDELFLSRTQYVSSEVNIERNGGHELSDEALLDKVEADECFYFYDNVFSNGFPKCGINKEYISTASIGFALSSLTIMAERAGINDNWDKVTYDMAYNRAEQILNNLLRIQYNQRVEPTLYGICGFFYKNIDEYGLRFEESEVSPAATAKLIAGALVCGEYFGGAIKAKADELYDNVNWTTFIDLDNNAFYYGWRPEYAKGYRSNYMFGYISDKIYDNYNDDVLLMSLLAIGSDIEKESYRKVYFSFKRELNTYQARSGNDIGKEYTFVSTLRGALNDYFSAHCFFDFSSLGTDSSYFIEDASYTDSIDWGENTLNAVMSNRQFCLDESTNYPFSFNENSWGISNVRRPDGGYEEYYGSVPSDKGAAYDGVISLHAVISSLPFFDRTLSDNDAFKVIRFYYDNYYRQSYGRYGFYSSVDNRGNFSTDYNAEELGMSVMMMENYRSGLLWNTLLSNRNITNVLKLIYPNGFDWLQVDVKNIVDNDNIGELLFGEHRVGTTIVSAEQYAEINFNFENPTAKLIIYTDNLNNPIPYTGNGDSAGMVGVVNPSMVAPLYWTVFDYLQPEGFNFADDIDKASKVQDVSSLGFTFDEAMMDARTVIDGFGNLAPYPIADRTTDSSTLYMYFACDFAGLKAQDYKTDTLTIEVFHE